MSTDQRSLVPTPLNPRDPATLQRRLSPGDRVRITTTDLPRTILELKATNPPTSDASLLVLTAPPIITTAQHAAHHATYHCTTSQSDSPMTVIESTHTANDTTARYLGSLTTIAHLPRLSTPDDAIAVSAEVRADE